MSAKSARVKKLALCSSRWCTSPFSLPLPFSSMILPMSPS